MTSLTRSCLKAAKKHIRDGLLPHVPCRSANCEQQVKGKFRKRFDWSLTNTFCIGTLHCDMKGKVETESVKRENYFPTVSGEFPGFIHVDPLLGKDEASMLCFASSNDLKSSQTMLTVRLTPMIGPNFEERWTFFPTMVSK